MRRWRQRLQRMEAEEAVVDEDEVEVLVRA
jgi:hypothetical protein